MDTFKLVSSFKPTGDQPEAINKLVEGVRKGYKEQTLMGVTGSGKTFTMANIIAQLNRPTLVLAHNKTLAGQLYSELKELFPNNRVEYFVSYYDSTEKLVLFGAVYIIFCGLYGLFGQDKTTWIE